MTGLQTCPRLRRVQSADEVGPLQHFLILNRYSTPTCELSAQALPFRRAAVANGTIVAPEPAVSDADRVGEPIARFSYQLKGLH
jgi:hypothetical protein